MRKFGIMLLLLLLAQGCGRKGPLFMPAEPAPPANQSSPQSSQSQP